MGKNPWATVKSDEQGFCCCRWNVYGGISTLLIREHAFDGEQTTEFGICRTVAATRNDCARLNAHADSFRKSYFAVGLYDHGVKCEDVP